MQQSRANLADRHSGISQVNSGEDDHNGSQNEELRIRE
mgnify:FL=1